MRVRRGLDGRRFERRRRVGLRRRRMAMTRMRIRRVTRAGRVFWVRVVVVGMIVRHLGRFRPRRFQPAV